MYYLVLDSNVVRTNPSWVLIFSSEPKIGHCSYIKTNSRKSIALYSARSLIKPTWINHDNVLNRKRIKYVFY